MDSELHPLCLTLRVLQLYFADPTFCSKGKPQRVVRVLRWKTA